MNNTTIQPAFGRGPLTKATVLAFVCLALLPYTADARQKKGYIGTHPDLSGTYNIATLTPLQRPKAFGDNLLLTKEQAAKMIAEEQARNDAKEDARIKYQEIAQKQNELRQFAENVQRQLAARQNTQMSLFTKEIMEVVTEVAKERSASLVLDTSGASQNGMPTVYTFDDSMDITAEVVTRINASKGEEEPAAAAE